MTRNTVFAFAALFLVGGAQIPAFAQDDQQGSMKSGMMGNGDDGSRGMMSGGMMGRGGMMGGMMSGNMGDCCAGMMGGRQRDGSSGRPNQQWRHLAPKPAPDQG